jgi:hypothetical protein
VSPEPSTTRISLCQALSGNDPVLLLQIRPRLSQKHFSFANVIRRGSHALAMVSGMFVASGFGRTREIISASCRTSKPSIERTACH